MRFDTIISVGNIVDGTGKREPFIPDIGSQGDCIAAIGDPEQAETRQRISVGEPLSTGATLRCLSRRNEVGPTSSNR